MLGLHHEALCHEHRVMLSSLCGAEHGTGHTEGCKSPPSPWFRAYSGCWGALGTHGCSALRCGHMESSSYCCHPEPTAGGTPLLAPASVGAVGQATGKDFGSGSSSGRIPQWREEWSWSLA